MSRILFQLLPEKYNDARKVVDESFRSLREVLDGGWRWREQVRAVIDTVIDTGALPVGIQAPGVRKPLAVLLLSAAEQDAANGALTVSSASVTWEWRGGQLIIHSVAGLSANTRYNAVIAVME